MAKFLIVFSTRWRGTKRIADGIAEGIRDNGIDVDVVDVKKIKNESEIEGYDGYLFGSSTYHGEMMQPMKTFLFIAEKAGLEGKVGGSFGSYGWSGEAPGRIFDTMKNIFKMNMVSGPLMLQYCTTDEEAKTAKGYGKQIAEKLM